MIFMVIAFRNIYNFCHFYHLLTFLTLGANEAFLKLMLSSKTKLWWHQLSFENNSSKNLNYFVFFSLIFSKLLIFFHLLPLFVALYEQPGFFVFYLMFCVSVMAYIYQATFFCVFCHQFLTMAVVFNALIVKVYALWILLFMIFSAFLKLCLPF